MGKPHLSNVRNLLLWAGGLFLMLGMVQCGSIEGKTSGSNTETKQKSVLTSEEDNSISSPPQLTTPKALLIIAEDRSGSTRNQRRLTAEQYKEILRSFARRYCGQVAIRVIGNPAPQEQNFYILTLPCPRPYKKINPNALLSEKGQIRRKNEAIRQANERLKAQNLQRIDGFVRKQIIPHIIHYRPYQGKDLTDIADALHHISLKVNEPTFRDYDVIEVLIISDGIHDASRLERPLSLNLNRGKLYVVGWKDTGIFRGRVKPLEFESVDGFIAFYSNH